MVYSGGPSPRLRARAPYAGRAPRKGRAVGRAWTHRAAAGRVVPAISARCYHVLKRRRPARSRTGPTRDGAERGLKKRSPTRPINIAFAGMLLRHQRTHHPSVAGSNPARPIAEPVHPEPGELPPPRSYAKP